MRTAFQTILLLQETYSELLIVFSGNDQKQNFKLTDIIQSKFCRADLKPAAELTYYLSCLSQQAMQITIFITAYALKTLNQKDLLKQSFIRLTITILFTTEFKNLLLPVLYIQKSSGCCHRRITPFLRAESSCKTSLSISQPFPRPIGDKP